MIVGLFMDIWLPTRKRHSSTKRKSTRRSKKRSKKQ